jgi:hypothetical protein
MSGWKPFKRLRVKLVAYVLPAYSSRWLDLRRTHRAGIYLRYQL